MLSVVYCVDDYVFELNFGLVCEIKICCIFRNIFIINSVKNVFCCGNSIKVIVNLVIYLI